MRIRPACYTDLPLISSIYAAAFWDEEVVADIMHPHRAKYPQDYADFWKRRIRESYWDYTHKIMVMCFEEGDGVKNEEGENEIIVGVADWHRMGSGWQEVWNLRTWWDIRILFKPLTTLVNSFTTLFHPNRAADRTQLTLEYRMYPFISHLWSGSRSICWDLHSLAVSPAHQNCGYGRQLVVWGLERARKEGVAASVLSARGKERFYQRCGFGGVCGWAWEGAGNPLRELKIMGGAIMFSDYEET